MTRPIAIAAGTLLLALGADPVLNTPEQFAAWMKTENAKWAAVVKKEGEPEDPVSR